MAKTISEMRSLPYAEKAANDEVLKITVIQNLKKLHFLGKNLKLLEKKCKEIRVPNLEPGSFCLPM